MQCYRKQKGQYRIDNPEALAARDTQDTGRRQTKPQQKTTKNHDEMSSIDPT